MVRKEVEFQLAGKTYRAIPNFHFVDMVETRFDFDSYAQRLSLGKTKISDIAWVIYSALKANGHDVEYSKVGDLVLDTPLPEIAKTTADLIGAVLYNGPEKPLPPPTDDVEGKSNAL